ncbi:MAG TPA: hypothetical protein VMX54_09300 [Vicinamibacteria bacterium]|nr:hypothetical protein [Vicinamibacteria bacterium]
MSLQPDFATAPRSRRRPSWEAVLLVGAALVLLYSAFAAWRARSEADFAVERVAVAHREIDQTAARLRAQSPVARDADRPAPSHILAAIARVLPGDARLVGLTVDYTHGVGLELQVEARDAAAWDRLLARLDVSADFADVEPGPEKREAEVRSVVRARWTGGGL